MTKLTLEDIVAHFNRPMTLNEHGCWIWQGTIDNRGYARYASSIVYGIVWRMAGFGLEVGHELCHTCPNKACCNPDHIYPATHKENMNDENRLAMGPKGKLTAVQIKELNLLLSQNIPKGRIAHQLDVSPQWISKFLRGEFKYAKPL